MSDKLPALRVVDLIRKLRKVGFVFDRQAKGSHEIWYNATTQRRVVIPNHPGDVSKGTLRKIIQQAGLTIDEFVAL
jgi:predicted RNA binding protein YcfA (HicA-like mRNA interferase family)